MKFGRVLLLIVLVGFGVLLAVQTRNEASVPRLVQQQARGHVAA